MKNCVLIQNIQQNLIDLKAISINQDSDLYKEQFSNQLNIIIKNLEDNLQYLIKDIYSKD